MIKREKTHRYPYTRDWNLSDLSHAKKWLISFPYPKMENRCPMQFDVELHLRERETLNWENALGVWRNVPTYLGDDHGGHLVLFLDAHQELADVWRDFETIQVKPVGEYIANHELCSFRYNLS